MIDTSKMASNEIMLKTLDRIFSDPDECKELVKLWEDFSREHWEDEVSSEIYIPQMEAYYENFEYVYFKVLEFVDDRKQSLVITPEELPCGKYNDAGYVDSYMDRAFKLLRDKKIVYWTSPDNFPSYRIV